MRLVNNTLLSPPPLTTEPIINQTTSPTTDTTSGSTTTAAAAAEVVDKATALLLEPPPALIEVDNGGRLFCHRCSFLSNGQGNNGQHASRLLLSESNGQPQASNGPLIRSQGAQSLVALAYTLFEKNVAQVGM